MQRMKRLIAGFLCLIMLFTAVPLEVFAEEFAENEDGLEELVESAIQSDTDVGSADLDAESAELPEDEEGEDTSLWVYSVNDAGYAVIEGYLDHEASELSIPYTIDGYYVVQIGEKAFVDNTALAKLYIHGNVQTIAEDAFDGLGVALIGYNGTYVATYASETGLDFRLKSDQDYFDFKDQVIDFSYAPKSRYSQIDATTVQMAMPEAAQLEVGDFFYLPVIYENLVHIFEVLSIETDGMYALITVQNADYEQTLEALSIKDEEVVADWSQAEWVDGVTVIEEKVEFEKPFGKSFSITFEKSLGEKKINWTTKKGSKELGSAKAYLFAEGSLDLKGKVSVDMSLLPFKVKEFSAIFEPGINIKGGIKFDSKNKNAELKDADKVTFADPVEGKVYLGKVPLVSAAGVVSFNAAIYLKFTAEGEVVVTFGGSGEIGVKYNPSTKKLNNVHKWNWTAPSIHASCKLELGLCSAAELELAVVGKTMALELFGGGVLDLNLKLRYFSDGSVEPGSGQTQTTGSGLCGDADLDGKIALNIKVELKKLRELLKLSSTKELFSIKMDIWRGHIDIDTVAGFKVGNKCIYEKTNRVDFCTFTEQQIDAVDVMYNATFKAPQIDEPDDNKFLGWYKDKNFTEQWDFENDKVKEDMTLYAKWEKGSKTVLFVTENEEIDGGNFNDQYIPGSQIVKPDIKIPCWRNDGWYLDKEFKDEWDFTKDTMPNDNLTLYSSWTYDETYDPFAGESSGKNWTISGGQLHYNGHTYEHVASYELFSAARADAESRGAYLVTISSQEEMDAVLDYVQDDCAQTTLWLGINSTTDWKYWLNGEKMEYWNGPDPVTSSSQYNGIFYRADGTWGTYDNGSTSHYIMEWGDYEVAPGFEEYVSKASDGSAQYSPSDDDDDSVSVVGFGEGEVVNISNTYDGKLVTEIEAYAFRNNKSVKTVTIPNTVEKIGDYAFAGCTALEEIVIPASVTSIGVNVFDGCTSLKKVTLPNGIQIVPNYMFRGCTSLEQILNMDELTEIKPYAFYGCTAIRSLRMPNKLQTIGEYAFYGCTALEELSLNALVQTIGYRAFYGCTKLSGSITIPVSCTSIGNEAFYNCGTLEDVFLSCNSTAIGSNAFYGVPADFHGKTEDGIETWCEANGKAFVNVDGTYRIRFVADPPADAQITISDLHLTSGEYIQEPSIPKLEGYMLEGWYTDPQFADRWDFARDKVEYADITLYAKWVEEVNVYTYYVEGGKAYISEYNGTDEDVIIPEKLGGLEVAGIGADAFAGAETIESVAIPKTLNVVEANAFTGCLNLYSITFPDGNDNFVFFDGVLYSADMKELIYAANARTFVKFVVPDGVERIYSGAFSNHTDLVSVEIPESVIEIGENAFPMSAFLTIFGPDADCAARKYAENNGMGYNEYVVTFYDGTTVLFSSVISTGELLYEFVDFENAYATYAGWYRDIECTMPWDFEVDTMPAGNLSLYLKWDSDFAVEESADGLTITQYVGSNSTIAIPEEINGSAVIGIAANAFVSTEETPIVSIMVPDCVTAIADGAISGTPAPTIVANAGSSAETYAETAGLTFEKRAYTISFETNGGANIPPMSFIPGEIPVLPTPVKSNHHFMGWYTTNFFGTAWTETDVMPMQDITLYARWRVINSLITDEFQYDVMEDGNAVITGYHGTKAAVSIPGTINGYRVTAIGDFAFAENKTILTVIIPESVQTIGEFAFSNSSVVTISGGSGVVSLGESCFSGANSLRTPLIPEGLKEIPSYCFEYCNAFVDVLIPEGITSIDAYAFYGCGFLSSVEIAESVTHIGAGAFAGCDNLTSVQLPTTLKGIDEDIFGDAQIDFFAANTLRILSVKQLTKASVQINWNEVENADGYRLYRKQGASGEYTLIKSVTDISTANYSLISGVTYYYKVSAYQNTETGSKTLAESEEYMIRIARLTTPSISQIQAASSSTATMKWSSVVGAEGYEIWRAYSYDGEYSLLKTVTDAETLNTGLMGGRSYFYKVRAFYDDDGTMEYSAFSDIYSFEMPLLYLDAPTNIRVRQTATGTILLEWDAVENADGYNIYRKRGNGNLVFIKTNLSTSTNNYNLTLGETYGYVVEAYCNTDKGTIIGPKSDMATVVIESLATPYIKSVSQSAVQTALVSWTNVSAADGYELWRSRTENGTYSLMKTITGTATSNYNLTVGGTYYYKVRAYVVSETGEYQYSSYSNAVPITILSVAKTRLKSVVQADATSVKVTWAYMSGAKSYEVWRSVNDDEHFELIRTTSGTAIQDRNLIDGQTYYYKVRAYDDSGDTVVYGEFSDTMYQCIMGTPVLATVEQVDDNKLYVAWDKVNDASGYELWCSVNGGSYTSFRSVTAASTIIDNLAYGSTYSYKVRAYKKVDDTIIYGGYSNAIAVKILSSPKINSLLQNGSNGVKLAWTADTAADGYEIWRCLSEDSGVFTKVKSVTGTSTTSFGLYETVASYKIRSYATVNGKKVFAPFSDAMSITILGTPTFGECLQASTSSVILSWSAVNSATSYKVFMSEDPDTGFKQIAMVTGLEALASALESEKTYYFKVKAVMQENGTAHEGAYSDVVSVYVSDIEAPEILSCKQTSDGVNITVRNHAGIDGIELWRADSNGKFVHIADSDTDAISDAALSSATHYQYKIRSYRNVDEARVYSAFSTILEFDILSAPTISRAAQLDAQTIYLQWNQIAGATAYEIIRSADNGETYTSIGTFTGTSATDTISTAGSYLYQIRACAAMGGDTNYSGWSAVVSATATIYADDVYPETAHNYEVQHRIYTYTKAGAEALTLNFSASTNTESGQDYIYVLDGNGYCVARLSGSIGATTITTAGDTFQLYFTTDNNGSGYGFSFDSITEANLVNAAKPIYSWHISGDTIYSDGTADLSVLNSRIVFNHLTHVEVEEGTKALANNMLDGFSRITEVTLPDGLTKIGNYVFQNCTGITEIEIPDSVTSIGNYAFYGSGLKDIAVSAGMDRISNYAFGNCKNLTEIEIPANIKAIYPDVFNGSVNLSKVTFNEGLEVIGYSAFYGTKIEEVVIPKSVWLLNFTSYANAEETSANYSTGTGASAFYNSKLKKVVFTEGETLINLHSFANCNLLTEVVVPDTVKTIRDYAFYGTGVSEIAVTSNMDRISSYAYGNCKNLTKVDIPGNVKAIYPNAFNGCSNMRDVTFHEGLEVVGYSAFSGTIIEEVIIPKSVWMLNFSGYANDEETRANYATGTGASAFYNSRLRRAAFTDGETTISRYAFANCTLLKEVYVPNTIKTIYDYAFYNTGLSDIVLPSGMDRIGSYVYANCKNITELDVPANVKAIYPRAFENCSNLTNVTFHEGLEVIGYSAFAGTSIEEVVIPKSVWMMNFSGYSNTEETYANGATGTEASAFYNSKLKKAIFTEGETSISKYAFYNCTNLTEFVIPDSVTTIEDYAFAGCTGFKELKLPASLKQISVGAFANCTGMTDLWVPASFGTATIGYSSGNGIFRGCNALTNVIFEEGITRIPNGSFAGSGIREIAIPDTVTEIGEYAFSGCTVLRKIDLPEGLKTIGNYAFQNCSILKRFTLPSTLTTLGERAFENCYDLAVVTIPSGVKVINNRVFYGCKSLNTVDITGNVTNINDAAFYGCTSLKDLTIPGTVNTIANNAFNGIAAVTAGPVGGDYDIKFGWTEYIPANAFYGISALSNVVIPEGIKYIGASAFYGSGLTTVTLPNSVINVGTYCFYNCDKLTDVVWSGNVGTIPERCFYDCDALTSVTIHEGVHTINSYAFNSCGALKNVMMPSTVNTIAGDAFNGIAVTNAGPVGGEYDYQFAWSKFIPTSAFQGVSSLVSVEIPDGITTIGANAFYGSGLTTVTLPDSVTKVGTYCFNNCDKLTEVTWSGNASAIPERCFYDCDALTSVVIPEGVTTINSNAFYSCGALKNVMMPSTVTSIAGDAFYGIASVSAGPVGGEYDYQYAWTEFIPANAFYRISSLSSVEIPDSISVIGVNAFYESGLTSITLPDSVTKVSTYCFQNCDKLTEITWSAGATTIPEGCFYDCDALESVTIPEGVITVGYRAFYGCNKLKNVMMPSTVTTVSSDSFDGVAVTSAGPVGGDYDCQFAWTTSIPAYAFDSMRSLTSVVIPENITTIGTYAFYDTGLTSITLPDSVTKVGTYCFANSDKLTDVAWSTNALTIPEYCFNDCDALETVTIPDGVTGIGYRAFYSCDKLKNITIPGTVTGVAEGAFVGTAATTAGPIGGGYDYEFGWTATIPNNAFREMSKLTSAVIPEGVTTIGTNAFYSSGLTNVSLPSTLVQISDYGFQNCDKLTSVVIPEGVTTIGYRAFHNSDNLKNITVPGTVTSIGDGAFYGISATTAGPIGGGYDYEFGWNTAIPNNAFREMSKLTSAVIPEGITSIGTYAFYSSGLSSISLPSTLTAVMDHSFNNCDNLTSIVIPEGAVSIGYRAFYSCGKLTSATIPDSVTTIGSGAFSNCSSSLVLYCSDESYAATYANANGLNHQQP